MADVLWIKAAVADAARLKDQHRGPYRVEAVGKRYRVVDIDDKAVLETRSQVVAAYMAGWPPEVVAKWADDVRRAVSESAEFQELQRRFDALLRQRGVERDEHDREVASLEAALDRAHDRIADMRLKLRELRRTASPVPRKVAAKKR